MRSSPPPEREISKRWSHCSIRTSYSGPTAGSRSRALGASREVRGATAVAEQALTFARFAKFGRVVLVNGAVGVVTMPDGKPFAVMGVTVADGRIVELDVLADPERLRHLDLAALDD